MTDAAPATVPVVRESHRARRDLGRAAKRARDRSRRRRRARRRHFAPQCRQFVRESTDPSAVSVQPPSGSPSRDEDRAQTLFLTARPSSAKFARRAAHSRRSAMARTKKKKRKKRAAAPMFEAARLRRPLRSVLRARTPSSTGLTFSGSQPLGVRAAQGPQSTLDDQLREAMREFFGRRLARHDRHPRLSPVGR